MGSPSPIFSDRLTSHVLTESKQSREDPSIREGKSVLIAIQQVPETIIHLKVL